MTQSAVQPLTFEGQLLAALERTSQEVEQLSGVVAGLDRRMQAQEVIEQRHALLCPNREAISGLLDSRQEHAQQIKSLQDAVLKLSLSNAKHDVIIVIATSLLVSILTAVITRLL